MRLQPPGTPRRRCGDALRVERPPDVPLMIRWWFQVLAYLAKQFLKLRSRILDPVATGLLQLPAMSLERRHQLERIPQGREWLFHGNDDGSAGAACNNANELGSA